MSLLNQLFISQPISHLSPANFLILLVTLLIVIGVAAAAAILSLERALGSLRLKRESSVEFKGKKYRKEELRYDPKHEPEKRMLYCAVFWEFWKRAKEEKGFRAQVHFVKHFFRLYRTRKKEGNPITWDDIKQIPRLDKKK